MRLKTLVSATRTSNGTSPFGGLLTMAVTDQPQARKARAILRPPWPMPSTPKVDGKLRRTFFKLSDFACHPWLGQPASGCRRGARKTKQTRRPYAAYRSRGDAPRAPIDRGYAAP